MFQAIVFLALTTSAFASATLDVLVNAAASFSATIQQQLEMLQMLSRHHQCGVADRIRGWRPLTRSIPSLGLIPGEGLG